VELKQAIYKRRSVSKFDPEGTIRPGDLEKIMEAATMAPSSYNMQHWHFLVIEDRERKMQLKNIALEQEKVADAAAVIVVFGNLQAHRQAKRFTDDLVAKGYLDVAEQTIALDIINEYYADPAHQQIEAVRNASLAAMILMLAAHDLGYGTCPMAGFDANKLCKTFQVPDHLVPILLIPVGRPAEEERPRKTRKQVTEVVTYNGF
jgi:nitroreductase